MSDIRNLSYLLGMEFKDTNMGVFMHQNKYAQYILKRFKMIKCNATITLLEIGAKLRKDIIDELVNSTLDKQIIGTFRYLCNTITNISQSVG